MIPATELISQIASNEFCGLRHPRTAGSSVKCRGGWPVGTRSMKVEPWGQAEAMDRIASSRQPQCGSLARRITRPQAINFEYGSTGAPLQRGANAPLNVRESIKCEISAVLETRYH